MVEEYCMDLTYGFDQYPIVNYIDNETLISKGEITERCKNLNISIDRITTEMPGNLRIKHITGCHSWQCSLEEMFKTFNFDYEMIGYGDSRFALLVTKQSQHTSWIEFNIKRIISEERLTVFKELITSLQKATETRLAISILKNGEYNVIPLENYDKIIEELGNEGKIIY